jgi:hypothetical protein
LNDLNLNLFIFLEEHSKHLDQDKINKILDQAKDPEWNEATLNANFDTYEIFFEEFVSYFKHIENSEKIRCINGPATPPDNKKKSMKPHQTCGYHISLYLSQVIEGCIKYVFVKADESIAIYSKNIGYLHQLCE